MGGVHGYAGNLWQSEEMKLLQGSLANHGTFFLLCHFSHPSLSQIPKYIRVALTSQASPLSTAEVH